jgi:hypothetical protein
MAFGWASSAVSVVVTIVGADGATLRTFATVRHRTKITRGPGSRAAGLAMAFKLIQAAQDRWRAVNAPHLVALVRAGVTFEAGKLVERPNQQPQPKAA